MNGFIEFTRERRYLHNVSPAAISWHTHALKWLPSEHPRQDQLKNVVLRMREKGLKETGCNAAIRAINSYQHWSSVCDRKCGAGCSIRESPWIRRREHGLNFASTTGSQMTGFLST
jgi:integrase/recombinase XerD